MKNTLLSLLILLFILGLNPSLTPAEYEPSTQIALPDGALARLGKGSVKKITFSPDGNTLADASSNG